MTDLGVCDLEAIYPKPSPRVIAKARPESTPTRKIYRDVAILRARHVGFRRQRRCLAARRQSRFCQVAGPNRLCCLTVRQQPDRQLPEIVEGSGFVQLIFFVRVSTRPCASAAKANFGEPELLASMEEFGKLPRAVLSVAVQRGLFPLRQSADALQIWSPDMRVEREIFPSISQVIHDQTKLGEPETQAEVEARNKTQSTAGRPYLLVPRSMNDIQCL